MVKGKRYQSLDDICADILAQLKQHEENLKAGIVKAELHKSMEEKEYKFVDWNQYSLDQLADYLRNKYMFQSSGEALAIYKLVEFYKKNK